MRTLVLYGTKGCHLCDKAEAMLAVMKGPALSIKYRDIAEDDALIDSMGERIPVIENEAGQQLGWPFSLLDVNRLLQS